MPVLKLSHRLALGYGAVIGLLIATSLLGLLRLRELNEVTDLALHERHASTRAVSVVTQELGGIARIMRNTLLFKEAALTQLQDIAPANGRMAGALAQLAQVARDPESRALLEEIASVHSAYIVNQEDFIRLVGEQKLGEARNLLVVDLHGYQESYFTLLGRLTEVQERLMAEASAEVRRSHAGARRLMLGFAAGAVLLSVLVTGLLSRYILRKLGGEPDYAASIAHQIAIGNLSPDIHIRAKDHHSLLFAMSAMRDALIERDAALRAVNRELAKNLEILKQTQDELVRSEKIAALGHLVAGVAHELNTPIGNCMLAASTIDAQSQQLHEAARAGLTRHALSDYVAAVQDGSRLLLRNLERAAELVSSFKKLAVDKGQAQGRRFQLADVVTQALLECQPWLKQSALTVTQQVPAELVLNSYPGPLIQVLVNLLSNALVHGYEPGAPGHVLISAHRLDAAQIELRVQDDGRGIAAEHLGRVFDPFFTTKLGSGGSGLGLHVSYNIVTGILAGHIHVESTPGGGCSVVIRLPVQALPG
ncbi:ATP-binding protein [Paucibacter soli]|uniref:ATP-binding protein n=1 Tax=Paucibacter soli TaxID=3133433 RepID=UPI0030985694